jgi:hypothetical protein
VFKLNPGKFKAIKLMRSRFINPLDHSPGDQKFRKRVVVIISNNLMKRFKLGGQSKLQSAKIWKTLHFVMGVIKKGNKKKLAYTSSVRHILEYVSACWGPYRGHIRGASRK